MSASRHVLRDWSAIVDQCATGTDSMRDRAAHHRVSMSAFEPKRKKIRQDWSAIANAIIRGNDRPRELSEHQGLPSNPLRTPSGRSSNTPAFRARVSKMPLTSLCATPVASESAMDAEVYAASTQAISRLRTTVAEEATTAGELRQVLKTMNEAWRLQRESAGLSPVKQPAPVAPRADPMVRIRLIGPDGSELQVSEGGSDEDST